ncbi:ComEC/Rec2 family competence protein [Prevotella melaninogenica]|uniref:ComEC/Rec2 family competence protein n=1 Tax=Prevotella melaninogenica TaxID=28132 RepID=UPI003C74AE51
MKKKMDLLMYPSVKLLLPLVLGIAVGDALEEDISSMFWWLMTISMIVITFVVWRKKYLQSLLLLFTVFLVGGTFVSVSRQAAKIQLPNKQITFKAVLLSNPVVHGKVIQTDLMVMTAGEPMKVKASILRDTITNRYRTLHLGDGIEAAAYLEKPMNFADATFDYARWLKLHGYSAETFIFYNQWQKTKVSLRQMSFLQRTSLSTALHREKLMRVLESNLDSTHLAVVSAMILGDKQLISKNIKEDYSITGASHVLALSGLHLTILYSLLLFILSWCERILPRMFKRGISELLILFILWSYVILVGMSSSVVRSAVMLTIYSFVTLLNRERLSVNTLALTAIIMLVSNPNSLFDIGFQLSFISVWSILLFYPLIYELIPLQQKKSLLVFRWLWGMIAVSLAAQMGTAPLIAFYFGRVSTIFAVSSLIAVPCTMLIVSASFCLLLLSPFPSLSSFIGKCICVITEGLNSSLHWLASLPCVSIEDVHVTIFQLFIYYFMLMAIWILWSFFAGKIEFK